MLDRVTDTYTAVAFWGDLWGWRVHVGTWNAVCEVKARAMLDL